MTDQARSIAETALAAARRAADPARAIAAALRSTPIGPVDLLATGKAGATTAEAALHALGDRVARALVIAPEPTLDRLPEHPALQALPGDHPLPTQRSLAAAVAVDAFLSGATNPILALLSGGGSAMIARPIPPLTLDHLRDLTDHLMRAGLDIHALNAVRAHTDHTKAGRLALRTRQPIRVLVLSDVIGDRLESVASGPFYGSPHGAARASRILHLAAAPTAAELATHFDRSPDPPIHPTDPRLAHVSHEIIASNRTVTNAIALTLRNLGFTPTVEDDITSQAHQAGERLATELLDEASPRTPRVVVMGGEPTVSGIRPGNLGGPMQEAAVAAALKLHDSTHSPSDWCVIAYATDGVDGPTPAAGASISASDLRTRPTLASDLRAALDAHNTHPVLDTAGLAIAGAPTGANLNDVLIAASAASI
ncbi:MAG: DUF4147 domain-containing protein [Planctomycetota bacterium]